MSIRVSTGYGDIRIDDVVIAKIVGQAVTECYGVVGLLNPALNIEELLSRQHWPKGVRVKMSDDEMEISVYLALELGIRISEVVRNIRQRVIYDIKRMVGWDFRRIIINVHVLSLRS